MVTARSRPSGARVLIVDDEVLIRWSLAEALSSLGHAVTGVDTCKQAADRLSRSEVFDVVLLDLRLPDSADLRLLERLRREWPASRVIVMSAYLTPALTERCMQMGAFAVVEKPFLLADMATLVQSAA
jgi:DNA-binding NtrC family response regulator